MKYLLDTNICIYLINERPMRVVERFKQHRVGDIGVSSITVSELAYGVAKSRSTKNRAALEQFLLPLHIADYDADAATAYGDLRAKLESLGKPIGPLDTLIAAHAFALGVVLVTNNEKEFKRVPKLKVENWA
jgi:tRNA(fMet)-specific endonuclease VapC